MDIYGGRDDVILPFCIVETEQASFYTHRIYLVLEFHHRCGSENVKD